MSNPTTPTPSLALRMRHAVVRNAAEDAMRCNDPAMRLTGRPCRKVPAQRLVVIAVRPQPSPSSHQSPRAFSCSRIATRFL